MQAPMAQFAREPEFLESVDRLTMLSRLARVLAHEFRNPLTTIFLHADILEDALRRLERSQGSQLLYFLRVMRADCARKGMPYARRRLVMRHSLICARVPWMCS
jgi:signal transduction histidine kinase